MLTRENYTVERINTLKKETGANIAVLERTIYAFGLLEALSSVGMPFIFKGGTALLILLENPQRLSTDIDIIVEPETVIEKYINAAGSVFPFMGVEEAKRNASSRIKKRHFKFMFQSPINERSIPVFLDAVFEHDPYPIAEQWPIKNKILLSKGADQFVTIPDKNCILGDKLTAFAPHTTGIPIGIGKEMEIIKQMFDCWTLLQEMDNYQLVTETYSRVSRLELGYRELLLTPEDCLKDTIESCICILGRGQINNNNYIHFLAGINSIQGHLFHNKINGENAGIYASEVMYLASCLLAHKHDYQRIDKPELYRNNSLNMKGIKKISSLRNIHPLAYAYIVKSFQILHEMGLYQYSVDNMASSI